MSRLTSKQIQRKRCLRSLCRGLEWLEARTLLAADVLVGDVVIVSEKSPIVEEAPISFSAEVAEDVESSEKDETIVDDQPKRELEDGADEHWDFPDAELMIAFRFLELGDGMEIEEEWATSASVESELVLDESIYYMSMSDDFLYDEIASSGPVGEEYFYTLSNDDSTERSDEVFLEMMSNDGTVELDEADGDAVIWYFGSAEQPESDIFATAGPLLSAWYNAENPLDANRDGVITALDALIVFNALSVFGSVELREIASASALIASLTDSVDANNDEHLSPLDALMRLNYLGELSLANVPTDSSSVGDQSRLSSPASILPGEWDEYETDSRDELLDEGFVEDDLNAIFGTRLRLADPDWQDDEFADTTAEDEFWSEYFKDDTDAPIEGALLELF